jgi:glycosyltransferase involved in cell wall biosynthesis
MNIAVNIHCLHPPLTGIGHYARNLMLQLLVHPEVDNLVGVSNAGWHSREEVAELVHGVQGIEPAALLPAVPGLLRRIAGRLPGAGRLRARFNHQRQGSARRRHQNYVYWEPNYLLLPIANPAVVTVHDLSHLRYPQFHPQSRLQELRLLPDSLRRARKLVTVSEFSRGELADLCAIEPADVAVVPPAISPQFCPEGDAAVAQLRQAYPLPEQFVLFAGTIEPRKNLPRLLRAYCNLPMDLQNDFKLVLAGGDGWHADEFEAVYSGLDTRNVIRLGYVRQEYLPALFRAASVLAYPSIYEGFGMPVLEAMASGTPVLTANAASMPEVAGGAALLADPLSSEDIGAALQQLLHSDSLREELRVRGLAVAAGYSWERSAQALLRCFKEAGQV